MKTPEQKPSERILEIASELAKFPESNWSIPEQQHFLQGIINYLDEQYENSRQES